jgi:hypothetical protein
MNGEPCVPDITRPASLDTYLEYRWSPLFCGAVAGRLRFNQRDARVTSDALSEPGPRDESSTFTVESDRPRTQVMRKLWRH